jgi:RNA polymerase sigma factor (sigma-70 family)
MTADRTQNESALVCAARAGDREALQVLLSGNWTWLKGVVYSVLAGRPDAQRRCGQDLDDVMQEVCLRVITRIHTLREPERFRAWLAVLARREALKCRRHRCRGLPARDARAGRGPQTRYFAFGNPRPRHEAAAGLEPPDGSVDEPGADLERRELCTRVLDAVQRLPEKYREVFVLAHTGELGSQPRGLAFGVPLTYAQIAEVLDIPVTTMQIRLVRARRMIRDRIAGNSEQGSQTPRIAFGVPHKVHENEHCG